MTVTIAGHGAVADLFRDRVVSDTTARVIVAPLVVEAVPVARITDEQIDRLWEQPMRAVITEMQRAHADGCRRIVVVVPTTGMSGGAQFAAVSAAAEAMRVLVKSAARQWGRTGVTVNAVGLAPETFGVDATVSGPVSIAPRALEGEVDPVATVSFLCSDGAAHVTGQTFVCDGGLWM
jgi:NAD(P)-dependent dehydrogenase (short-subunit alcohol dehydrogenase family)